MNRNTLKIIAAITMLIDHIGYILFPDIAILRIIGRISFPIFAFMIAEGCKYTKNKLKYFLGIFILGVICQTALYLYNGNSYMCILITFSLSILIIYALQYFKDKLCDDSGIDITIFSMIIFIFTIFMVSLFTNLVAVDYGIYGVLVPVCASIFHNTKYDNKYLNVFMMMIPLLLLTPSIKYEIYFLLSIPLLLLYTGKNGKLNLKYFFYIFYPAHLVVLEIIKLWI